MEFFKIRKDIPFMRHALVFNIISLVTFLAAVFFLFSRGLNFGIDFTGGTLMEVQYQQEANLPKIRQSLETLGVRDFSVQAFGTSRDVLIRISSNQSIPAEKLSPTIRETLATNTPGAVVTREEFVGPQIGDELKEMGQWAVFLVSIGIVLYLAFRFESWKFGVAAIIANLHDVVIILGCFAFFQWDFSLTVLAAVLAILGYSVNESVVVFDRIRENFRKMRKASTQEIIDNAITATMSRTIITHGSTQLAVLSMLLFGGEVLHYFAVALTIGILFGIYSSVFVASALIMWFGVSREDLVQPRREAADELP